MKLIQNPDAKSKFQSYPPKVRKQMKKLRNLVLETAKETEGLEQLEETLKWGEPSYLTKHGSTLRMDWKEKKPDQYALYFKCTSKLIISIREVYGDLFTYEKNRAILFALDDKVPEKEIKHCMQLALTYHKVKHLPLLGADE